MRTLFLDLAHHAGLVACAEDGAIKASKEAGNRINDKDLLPLIEALMKSAGWTYNDLTNIACVTGPGGFTSIRVSVSAVNALAWSLDIPVAAIHGSDLFIARTSEKNVVWLHSTKREELFVRGFGTNKKLWPEAVHRMKADLDKELPSSFLYMGELIPEHEEWLRAKGGAPINLEPVEDVLPTVLSTLPFEHGQLEPWYGREG